MKGRYEMAELRTNNMDTLELVDRPQTCLIDFQRIQVAPQQPPVNDEFKKLTIIERQELLQKLIKRVKSI